jgi:hypothetical protein
MNWVLEILITHRRLRGLTQDQLWELIEKSDDIEALRTIKEFLEQRSFRYQHIEAIVPGMIDRIVERAKLILWKQQEEILRLKFMVMVGDPFK